MFRKLLTNIRREKHMRKSEDIEDSEADQYRLDREVPDNLETATVAMGCFWGVEALFSGLKGVYRTRVGYTGGSKENPTYRSLGKHTETVQLDYDPEEISYRDILKIFFNKHNHERKQKAQYASRIFYGDEEQKEVAEDVRPERSSTTIDELETFWIAEDYHQKYRLRGTREAEEILENYTDEQLINSTMTAKLNAARAGKLEHSIEDEEFERLSQRFR